MGESQGALRITPELGAGGGGEGGAWGGGGGVVHE